MLQRFVHFLEKSPTVYHAAREIGARFAEAQFLPLEEKEPWKLEPGKSYFLIREGTLVAAFRMPKRKPHSCLLLASHTDSPSLRLKPLPEVFAQGIGELSAELYGGPVLATWLDRDLAVAGRVFFQNKQGRLETKAIFLDDSPVVIPGLAIHLNREVNEKGLLVHKQDHLKAVFSLQEKPHLFVERLSRQLNAEKLLSFDLFLVPLEKPRFNGFHNELISSYRVDNLSSAFACLEALIHAKERKDGLQMALFWDHEEIGSQTSAGADSVFLNELLERIVASYSMSREEFFQMKSRSLSLSCDVAHASHPNHPDKNEPQNSPRLGLGPAIKFSSRYATTAQSAAPLFALALEQKIPLQTAASRSDLSSGGTVGAMMAANSGIQTVDIGIGCWAMHSARETMSCQDLLFLYELLRISLEKSPLECEEE